MKTVVQRDHSYSKAKKFKRFSVNIRHLKRLSKIRQYLDNVQFLERTLNLILYRVASAQKHMSAITRAINVALK